MKTLGTLIKKESSNGCFVTLSRTHTMIKGVGSKYMYIVHLHWTAFDRFGNDDYYTYDNMKDAKEMFSIFSQRNTKIYIDM